MSSRDTDIDGVVSTTHHLAEQAKKEYEEAQLGVEHARHQLKLAEERLEQARDAYFGTDLKRDCSWNKMYKQLVAYKAEHDGDVLVPTTKDSPAEVKKLAKWVQNQRVHYKYYMNGDKKHIKEHRIAALNQVSIGLRCLISRLIHAAHEFNFMIW